MTKIFQKNIKFLYGEYDDFYIGIVIWTFILSLLSLVSSLIPNLYFNLNFGEQMLFLIAILFSYTLFVRRYIKEFDIYKNNIIKK